MRQLTELHGGTVRADSAGEGQGSTFTVSRPVAGDPEHDAAQGDGDRGISDDCRSLSGLKVMVAIEGGISPI